MTPRTREALVQSVLAHGREFGAANQFFHAAVAARLGLGPTDIKAMDLLQQGEPRTPKQLGEELGLAPASVTGLLRRLEGQGLVVREPHPHDRRQVLVRLQPGAVNRVAPLFARLESELRAMMDGHTKAELELLESMLAELTERLRMAGTH